MKRILNSCEKTAYWWIITIRTKLDEIYRNPKYFGKDEEAFKKLFENYSEKDWRFLYERICDYIKDQTTLSQSTAKKGHQVINEILGSPDISLSPRQSKPTVLDMYPNNVYATCKSKDKIPSSYDDSFDYVLGANEEELEFYNLVLSIIIVIREKNREFNSLEILRENFCAAYLNTDDLNTITRKFDMVIAVLERYSIIKTNKDVIVEWPKEIDGNNLEKYLGEARYYSEGVLRENSISVERINGDVSCDIKANNCMKQLEAVEKVLDEIESTYDKLDEWNTTWGEQLSDAYSITLSEKSTDDYLEAMEAMYNWQYLLKDVHGKNIRDGEPLRVVDLSDGLDEHECEFGKVKLYNIIYGNSEMEITFHNDGLISLSKFFKGEMNGLSYDASFNVLNPNDFDIHIPSRLNKKQKGECHISLEDGIITEKFKNIEIVKDIKSGDGTAKITEKYGDFVVTYNVQCFNGTVVYNSVEIMVVSGNDECRLFHFADVKEIEQMTVMLRDIYNLYTKNKSIASKCKEDEQFLYILITLLNLIAYKMTRSTADVGEFLYAKETSVIEKLKTIRNEVPLAGLVERINKCLSYANVDEGQKHYKKEAANN